MGVPDTENQNFKSSVCATIKIHQFSQLTDYQLNKNSKYVTIAEICAIA